VRVTAKGWELDKGGKPTLFTTAQGLLAELTGHPTGRHWSVDRYFGLGAHAPRPLLGQADVLDLLGIKPTTERITLLEPLAPSLLAFHSNTPDTAISVPAKNPRESKRIIENVRETARISENQRESEKNHRECARNPEKHPQRKSSELVISGPVGIDLVNRSDEVRKLLFAGFGRRIFAAHYDPEDVLQEVYRKLIVANQGKRPWDPSLSSFGHYVHMVCSSALSNYHRKMKRRRQFEQSGLGGYQDGVYATRDAASCITRAAPQAAEQAGCELAEAADDLMDFMLDMPRGGSNEARLALDVLPYVAAGTSRARIAALLEVSAAAVSRAISFLRKTALAWRESLTH
jgi:DNA-directed RNA polymerase specialized sigma24 family protein